MKYKNGAPVHVGDKVSIDIKYSGIVVANIEDNDCSEEEPKEKWDYLKTGVMIDTDFGGLVHYEQDSLIEDEVELISRAYLHL